MAALDHFHTERLRLVGGDLTTVTAITNRGPPEPVYNLEVHGEHVYFVGVNGVLVHNNYHTDTYLRKQAAFERYQANGGTLLKGKWGKKYEALRKARRAKHGEVQNHHLISNPIVDALDRVGIDGLALRNRRSLQYSSAPGQHIGYEKWHMAVDDEVVNFIGSTRNISEKSLLRFMHDLYQRPDIAKRIPNVNLGF